MGKNVKPSCVLFHEQPQAGLCRRLILLRA